MFALAFGVALAVDLITKTLVVRALAPGRIVPDARWSPVRLHHVENARVPGAPAAMLVCWVACTVGSVLLALTVFESAALAQVGLGLAAGGATGNVPDRLRGRAIVDFVELGRWPVFNIADAAITCGIALTLGSMA